MIEGQTASATAPDAVAGWAPFEKPVPTASNPFAARPYVYTVVTPDMDASIHFWRDVMEHEVIDRGTLPANQSTLPSVGHAGRAYTLLRHREQVTAERGVIRLLAAPPHARPNRPHPGSRIVDPGLAIMEGHPANSGPAYEKLTAAGVKTVSPPQYYFFGPASKPWNSSTTFSAFGPAGEQMFLSCQNVPDQYMQRRPVAYDGVIGPIRQHTMMCFDRWPVVEFYEAVFGMTLVLDRYVGQESINTLAGAPAGTYYRFLKFDWGELWEFRQWRPPATPPWPTDLDKTGLAMVTMLVDSLDVVRDRVTKASIAILGEGSLPLPEAKAKPAIYVRGPLGELLEIVGRG